MTIYYEYWSDMEHMFSSNPNLDYQITDYGFDTQMQKWFIELSILTADFDPYDI